MSYIQNKKIFTRELINFLEIDNKPYYITYIYNLFFEKIESYKKFNSYCLKDENIRSLLNISDNYGYYWNKKSIKNLIKNNHIIYNTLPDNIFSMNITDITPTIHMITI